MFSFIDFYKYPSIEREDIYQAFLGTDEPNENCRLTFCPFLIEETETYFKFIEYVWQKDDYFEVVVKVSNDLNEVFIESFSVVEKISSNKDAKLTFGNCIYIQDKIKAYTTHYKNNIDSKLVNLTLDNKESNLLLKAFTKNILSLSKKYGLDIVAITEYGPSFEYIEFMVHAENLMWSVYQYPIRIDSRGFIELLGDEAEKTIVKHKGLDFFLIPMFDVPREKILTEFKNKVKPILKAMLKEVVEL